MILTVRDYFISSIFVIYYKTSKWKKNEAVLIMFLFFKGIQEFYLLQKPTCLFYFDYKRSPKS